MIQSYPLHSLSKGSWFKLICGASYQHLPMVRSLALAYSLAGADCIDVAADPAVITAALEGIRVAKELQQQNDLFSTSKNYDCQLSSLNPKSDSPRSSSKLLIAGDRQVSNQTDSPWLMISINDGEDPHFRKAEFNPDQCPPDCFQPCMGICPADAIEANSIGIINDLCYGCGRCLPICPSGLIETRARKSSPQEVVSLIELMSIDAIEIHTQVGHYNDFKNLWQYIQPIVGKLKLLAISCTDGENVVNYLRSLHRLIAPLPCPLIWQTDGRSMSGDIGKGTTHATVSFAHKVLQADLPGYVQLAGGTNDYTVKKLKRSQLLQQSNPVSPTKSIAGVAYGSYARGILSPILNQLETTELQNIQSNLITSQPMNELNQQSAIISDLKLEQDQNLLRQAVSKASQLVNQIKKAS